MALARPKLSDGHPSRRNLRQGASVASSQPAQAVRSAERFESAISMLRRHAGVIIAVIVAGVAAGVYAGSLDAPRYVARAIVRSAATTPDANATASSSVASMTSMVQTRSLLRDAVNASGLRLLPPSEDLPQSFLSDAQVSLPPGMRDSVKLDFGDDIAVHHAGRLQSSPYTVPVDAGGVRFTVLRRPAVSRAVVMILSEDQAVDSLAHVIRVAGRVTAGTATIEATSRDSARAMLMVNAVAAAASANVSANVSASAGVAPSAIATADAAPPSRADSLIAAARTKLGALQRSRERRLAQQSATADDSALTDFQSQRAALETQRRVYDKLLEGLRSPNELTANLQALASLPAAQVNPLLSQLYGQLVSYQITRDSLTAGEWGRAATSPDVVRIDQMISSLSKRVEDLLHGSVNGIGTQIDAIDRNRDRVTSTHTIAAPESAEAAIGRQVTTELQKTQDALRVTAAPAATQVTSTASTISVLAIATQSEALGDRRKLWWIGGALAGILLGLGAAMTLEGMDRSIRSAGDIERVLGVPLLAVVPPISMQAVTPSGALSERTAHVATEGVKTRRRRKHDDLNDAEVAMLRALVPVVSESSESTVAAAPAPAAVPRSAALARVRVPEAYRTLRTNLMYSQHAEGLTTLVVTSASPSEGKSTTAMHLATAFADQGLKVVLVDADLRRSRLGDTLGIESRPGLTDLFDDLAKLPEIIRSSGRVDVVLAGSVAENPSELLGTSSMREMLESLARDYDVVLIDTPSVLTASDAAVLSATADGVIMVVRAGSTDRRAAQHAMQQLRHVRALVVGAVMNDPDGALTPVESVGEDA